MVRIHSSFFRAENAQIIILFEIPGKGVAGRKEDKRMNTIVLMGRLARDPETKLTSTQKGQTKVSRFPLVVKEIAQAKHL